MIRSLSFINRNYLSVCIINLILNMGQFITQALMPKYADSMNASGAVIGVIVSVFAGGALVMRVFAGPAIDSYSKKKIMLIGIGILFIAFIGYALVDSVKWLIVFRIVHGFSLGITIVACLAMVSDTLTEEKLMTGIVYFSIVNALSTALGPAAGLAMVQSVGYKSTFLICAVFTLLAGIIVIKWAPPEKTGKKAFIISLDRIVAKEALVPAGMMLCIAAAYTSIMSFLILYAESINVVGIELFFTVYAVCIIVTRPLAGKMAGKYGSGKVLPVMLAIFAVGMLIISFSTNLKTFLVAAVLVALGFGSCHPIYQALCMKSVTPDRRGSASATGYFGLDIGFMLAPIVAGKILDIFGYRMVFISSIVYIAMAFAICLSNKNKINKIEGRVYTEQM